jgi:hypothetical protein
MPDHDFRSGDVVRCTSKDYSQQLNITGLSGIVMGTKPHHIHVWFEQLKRGFWLNYDILRKLPEADLTPLLRRIQTLSYLLDAEEWELEETAERFRLILYLDAVSLETLQEIRGYLDIDYQALSLFPEGMGRMIAQIDWMK